METKLIVVVLFNKLKKEMVLCILTYHNICWDTINNNLCNIGFSNALYKIVELLKLFLSILHIRWNIYNLNKHGTFRTIN